MTPCVGVDGVCPPLCTYKELQDGTYNLVDVLRFNETIEALAKARKDAIARAKQGAK